MSDFDLVVRLDSRTKAVILQAARRRGMSMSDYVRMVAGMHAKADVEGTAVDVITLSPQEQMEFWEALHAEPELTDAQRELGSLLRGDAPEAPPVRE